MVAISHSYGWLGGGRDGGGGWYVCRTKPGGIGRMSGDARALPECKVKTLITPPSRYTALAMVEPELVGLPGTTLT